MTLEAPHELLEAYYDDALDDAARAAFEQHLVGCARCQARLDELMALDAVTHEARSAPAPASAAAPGVTPITAARRHPKRRVWVVAAAVAAAAALAVLVWPRDPRHGGPPVDTLAVALAPERHIEARLSWAPAAAHRPYAPQRSGAPGDDAGDPAARAVTAELERRGDARGLAGAWLLAGAPERALAALGDTRGADADADRAAILLSLARADEALAAADAALAAAPEHAGARWNRALALGQLGLFHAAAAEWHRVAERDAPAWAAEARARAAALDRDLAARRARAGQREAGPPGAEAPAPPAGDVPAARRALAAARAADDLAGARAAILSWKWAAEAAGKTAEARALAEELALSAP